MWGLDVRQRGLLLAVIVCSVDFSLSFSSAYYSPLSISKVHILRQRTGHSLLCPPHGSTSLSGSNWRKQPFTWSSQRVSSIKGLKCSGQLDDDSDTEDPIYTIFESREQRNGVGSRKSLPPPSAALGPVRGPHRWLSKPERMQGAACFDAPPSEVLHFTQQLPVPSAGTAQVLVRVHTVAFNDLDVKAMRGSSPRNTTVFVPGFEFAGTVVELGGGCRRLSVGDAVWGLLPPQDGGACAEFVAVDEERVALKPLDLEWVYAAAMPLGASAALRCVLGHPPAQWPPQPLTYLDKKVLIIGAACAEGLFTLQLCAQLGAEVTAIILPPAPASDAQLLQRFGATWTASLLPDPRALRSIAKDTPEGFSLIVDCAHPHESFPDEQRRLLARGGRLLARAPHGGLEEVHVRAGKRQRLKRLLKRVLRMRQSRRGAAGDVPLFQYLDSVRFLCDKKVLVPVLDSRAPFFLQDASSAAASLHSRLLRLPLQTYKVLALACEGPVCLLTVKGPRIAFLPKGVLVVSFEGEGGVEELELDYEGCAEGLQPGETQFVIPDAAAIGSELRPRMKVQGNAGTGKIVVKVWPKCQALTLSQVERAMKLQQGKKKATRLDLKTD